MTNSTAVPAIYRAHARYWLFALVCVVMLCLFSGSLLRSYDSGSAFFLAVCLFGAIWSAANSLSRVEVNDTGVLLRMPPGRVQRVEYRQLFSATENGRLLPAIVLLYHPLSNDGLVDLDEVCTCSLPGVENQAILLEQLQARILH